MIASIVEDAILHFDGDRYQLLAWCVMPNHVHVIIEPSGGHSLGAIVRSWKSFTANRANRALGRAGPFWHRDYFDRFIRDEGHLFRTIDYVENNPGEGGPSVRPNRLAVEFGSTPRMSEPEARGPEDYDPRRHSAISRSLV